MPDDERMPLVAVSIGMPVYNGEQYLREALDSVLAQTVEDFEVIISDNASTDNTRKICEEYAIKDKRIKYLRQETNIGVVSNFNYVLANARGKYFTWLACDDFIGPRFLEKTTRHLEQNNDVLLCACDFNLVNENGAKIKMERLEALYPSVTWSRARHSFFRFPMSNVYFTIYGVFRRLDIENFGIKVSATWLGLSSGLETPFLARVAISGRIVAIPELLRTYRIHQNSVCRVETRSPILAFHRYVHYVLIRLDQQRVIISSNVPLQTKLKLLWNSWVFIGNRVFSRFAQMITRDRSKQTPRMK